MILKTGGTWPGALRTGGLERSLEIATNTDFADLITPVLDKNEKAPPTNVDEALDKIGRPCRDRTCDQRIKSSKLSDF
jgi:hypothetical protein